MKPHAFARLKYTKDLYSAIVRFSLGLFIALYVWVGMSNGDFSLSIIEYTSFASFYFIITISLALDLLRTPKSPNRRYVTLVFDLSCTTYAISLTGGSSSEFILIYLWLYIAYGTRYGANYLSVAVIIVILEYNYILFTDSTWFSNPLTACAQLFVLFIMPLYLHSMLKQLREAKLIAEQATQAKSNFLATMSHEIRTPMSGIIGTAHLLQSTKQSKEQKEYTQALLDASKSLHALINDILDFSKIEANKLQLQTAPFDLHNTINEVVSVLSSDAEQRALDFIIYIDPDIPSFVIGDSQRIRQILFNLVGNAIKFTQKGEVILKVSTITTFDEQHLKKSHSLSESRTLEHHKEHDITLCFDIIDTGIGISHEQKKVIFDSFTQVNEQQNRKLGGTGLGTTIAKQLVELMGGKIGLDSQLGEGSHFWFQLSLAVEKQGNIKERYHNRFKSQKVALLVCKETLYETLDAYCHFFGFSVTRCYCESELLAILEQSINQATPFRLLILSASRNKNMPVKLANKINNLNFGQYPAPKKIYLNYLTKRSSDQLLGGKLFDAYISKPVIFERFADLLLDLLSPPNKSIKKEICCDLQHLSLTILVAEDEDINAMVLTSFLHEAGHKTTRVINGAQAIEALSQESYDMAFMDMRMPEMNGLEATISWRQQEAKGQHMPIIALTANATTDDRQACLAAGMDDFITKPITPEQLNAAVTKFYQK